MRLLRIVLPELVGILLLATIIGVFANFFPALNYAVYKQGEQQESLIEMPMFMQAPKGPFTLRFQFHTWLLSPQYFVIYFDDCIDAVFVNGRALDVEKLHYCDARYPLELDFGNSLAVGDNDVEFVLQNLGGAAGLAINCSWTDPELLLLILLFSFAVLYYRDKFGRCIYVRYTGLLSDETVLARFLGISAGTLLVWVCEILFFASLAYAFIFLIWQLHFDLLGIYNGDATLYWMTGRGIVEGYKPYVDFFESKPPGIFILSALSYYFLDSVYLTSVVSFLAPILIVVIALMLSFRTLSAWKGSLVRANNLRYFWYLWAISIFSVLTALFSWFSSGAVQVEPIGAVFSLVFVALFSSIKGSRVSKYNMSLLTLSIFCAVGMKEPFVIVILACALLLANSIRHFVQGFILPALMAAILGLVTIKVFGYWEGYFQIYLPEMLFNYVPTTGPIWERGLRWIFIWRKLIQFSWCYEYLLPLMMVSYCIQPGLSRWQDIVIICWRLVRLLIAAFLVILCVGLGGTYWRQHFVFIIPAMMALAFVAFKQVLELRQVFSRVCLCILYSVLLLLALYSIPFTSLSENVENIRWQEKVLRSEAEILDNMMETCGYKRYLYLGQNGPSIFQFTRHLPMGPFFIQWRYLFSSSRKDFQNRFMQQLSQVDLIVENSRDLGDLEGEVSRYIEDNFSSKVPACADEKALSRMSNNKLAWRKKSLGIERAE